MRTKFIVESVTSFGNKSVTAKLRAVVGADSEENKSFSRLTPWASLEIQVTNPDSVDFFQPGEQYYLDFSKSEQLES